MSASDKSINKYTDKIKEITGNRLEIYAAISDIEHILDKGYANNLVDALNIDDVYLTLSQCSEIEKQDIDRKISDAISKMS
jgi:hypothetical protein